MKIKYNSTYMNSILRLLSTYITFSLILDFYV